MGETVGFEELCQRPCALTDLGSAYEFFSRDALKFLRGDDEALRGYDLAQSSKGTEFADALFPKILRYAQENYSAPLRLLEQLVVNEHLAIDELLLDKKARFYPPSEETLALFDSPWFITCRLPTEVRVTAAREIERHHTFLASLHDRQDFGFFHGDKYAHDNWLDSDVYHSHCFADSSDAPERALFYLSVASQACIPLCVSPIKQQQIEALSRLQYKGIHELLTQYAMDGFLSKDENEQIAKKFKPVVAPLPPIQEMIVWNSYKKNVTPLEAFKKIRSSDEASEYRNLIRKLSLQRMGNLEQRNRADQTLKDIQKQMGFWKTYPPSGKWLTKCEINIQEIEGVGWLAKLIGKWDKVPIWDLLLRRPDPAYVFMSRWFSSAEAV